MKLEYDKVENKKSVLAQYLERKEKYGLKIDDIVAIMGDLLIAGVDTVAKKLFYNVYF